MKKIFLFLAFMLSITLAKAQFTTVNITNGGTSGITLCQFYGAPAGASPCMLGPINIGMNSITAPGPYSFTVSSFTWSGGVAPVNLNYLTLIVNRGGGSYDVDRKSLCFGGMTPPTPSLPTTLTYNFPLVGTSAIVSFSSSAPGVLDVSIP